MVKTIFKLSTAFLIVACTQKDTVPKVDIRGKIVEIEPASIKNGFHFPAVAKRMIEVEGKQMPLSEFLKTYCVGETKEKDPTCDRGQRIEAIDMSSGPKKNLPAGL